MAARGGGLLFSAAHRADLTYNQIKNEEEERKKTTMLKIKNTVKRFMSDKKAEGFLDVAMKILIVVVIGAAVLLIMNTAIPGLFQGLIDKVSNSLTGITILP
jgi:uncharacterized oligopeptide transporter (OPT) family protein